MDHQDYDAAAPPFGAPSPTPPPLDAKQERALRWRALLRWAVLIIGLGLALWVAALLTPDGPIGADRARANCRLQYPGDAAGVEACVKAHGS